MYVQGTRNTSGDGSAVATAGATERLRLGEFIQLQLQAAGPVTVLLKLGSTTIYSVVLVNAGDGVMLQNVPPMVGAADADLLINLSAAVAVGYVISYDTF